MDKNMVMTLAGIFAVSNMGMNLPSVDTVVRAVKHPPQTPNSSAIMFGEQYMESNEHEKIFTDEAKMWVKTLKRDGEKKARATWPDIFALYDQAVLSAEKS